MTIGSAGEHTWRYRMWQHLRATYGGPFAVVGPRETLYDKATDTPTSYEYADPDFPHFHLAGWGEGWLHMAPLIGEAVRAHRADVLLVSLGLIDLGFYTNATQTADNMRSFVAAARVARPSVRMVFLPVIPNVRAETDAPFATEVALFNELQAKAVADLDAPAPPPPGLPPGLVRRHPRHVRRHPPERVRRAQDHGGVRGGDASGVGGGWGVRRGRPGRGRQHPTPGAPLLVEAVGPPLSRGT